MKLPPVVPSPVEIGHYALLMIGAGLLSAFILSHLPAARDYLRRSGL